MPDYTYETLLKEICEEFYCYAEFGSYQGDWWAKVKYNGKKCWIHGWFGSCSGCDWLLHQYALDCSPKEILDSFKCEYLDDSMVFTQEEAEKEASKNIKWDSDAEDMLNYIKEHRD